MNLADLGAEVIKIEVPGRGDDSRSFAPILPGGDSGYFYSVNRGKKSVTIDLRTKEGAELLIQLADKSDVVVENFSPGTMERFGVGYKHLSASNPKIILCSISGFGQSGPMSSAPAYDIVAQALGGTMSITDIRAATRCDAACRSAICRARSTASSESSSRCAPATRPARASTSTSRCSTARWRCSRTPSRGSRSRAKCRGRSARGIRRLRPSSSFARPMASSSRAPATRRFGSACAMRSECRS